jgi:hypothetical protein
MVELSIENQNELLNICQISYECLFAIISYDNKQQLPIWLLVAMIFHYWYYQILLLNAISVWQYLSEGKIHFCSWALPKSYLVYLPIVVTCNFYGYLWYLSGYDFIETTECSFWKITVWIIWFWHIYRDIKYTLYKIKKIVGGKKRKILWLWACD